MAFLALTIINGLVGMHFGHFWPPRTPGGCQGGMGGSVGPKFSTFCGATFGFQNVKFWIVSTENTIFSKFLAKNSPSRGQKWPFWAQMGMQKSGFFSKTPSSNWLKSHQKYPFWSITMSENDGHDHSLKIFQGAKIEIFGPAHMPTGRKGATSHERPKMTLKHFPLV